MRLTDFKALTFDCYGTLIDWETGIIEGLRPLVEKADPGLTRNAILETHAYHESTSQQQAPAKPYAELLAVVCKRIAEEWGVPTTWESCLVYGRSVRSWPAFGDTAAALGYLSRFYKLALLSNVDNASLEHSLPRLGVTFDALYTAEDIGSYKPSHRNFEYMVASMRRLGIEKHEILHVSESLYHDHLPARRAGIASCRINRRHGQDGFGATMGPRAETLEAAYRLAFTSMAELVEAHRAETAA